MSDTHLVDGDQVLFMPSFGPAIVVVQPGRIAGSGPATAGGSKLCLDGDEARVQVPGCSYMTSQYCIPGVGTLKIDRLAADQKASKTQHGGKALLLVGSQFIAKFEVQAPAMQPPPGPGAPIPDGTPSYSGQGRFISLNRLSRAT